jgi:hypothetical protein
MGRDIQAVKITGEDRRIYGDKLRQSLDVLTRMLREQKFEAGPSRVGLEIELALVSEQMSPALRNERVLDAITDPAWETELGQFNLEVNVPPRPLSGNALTELEGQIRASLDAADQAARGTGSRLVMVGILPTLGEQHMSERALSANKRYRVLNEQILAARGEDVRIQIDGAEQVLTYAVAGDQDHPVPAGHGHPAGAAEAPGGTTAGVVRRALDHLGPRVVRGERRLFPGTAAGLRRRGAAGGA